MAGIGRRAFTSGLLTAAAGGVRAGEPAAAVPPAGSLTDVAGLRIGHFTERRRPTGCTVILAEAGAVCGVDVRGGAPGTRETDLLDPVNSVQAVHAVVLSGGSAFGLEAASGVVRYLEEKGIGFAVGEARVPIVPAAILFDLGIGDWRIRPDAAAGYQAARAASTERPAEGSVGVGAGATVGKLLGFGGAMKGGVGTAAIHRPDGVVVAALVAVNALGDVHDPFTARLLAGARDSTGRLGGAMASLLAGATPGRPLAGQNTTIGVVGTNVALTKAEATKVAQMAQDGLARAIRPAHTPWDGDTLFALSTGRVKLEDPALLVGSLAAEVVASAIVRAVRLATGLPGIPAAGDLDEQP